jgi:hypothetical protein
LKGRRSAARPDFNAARFDDGVDFPFARFGGGASFVAAAFTGARTASFARVRAVGTLDFSQSSFAGPGGEPGVADFSFLASTGNLVFRDALFGREMTLLMDRVSVGGMAMAVANARAVRPKGAKGQERVLTLIKAEANASGDLRTANRADYELRVLRSRDDSRRQRLQDFVYRWGTGYFDRPLNPLIVLTCLAAAVSMIRARPRRRVVDERPYLSHTPLRPARRTRPNLPSTIFSAHSYVARVLRELSRSIGRVVPGRSTTTDAPRPNVARQAEIYVYRVLVACALIGLANTNPAFKRLVDALH